MPDVSPRFKDSGAWKCRKDNAACTRTKPCASCRGLRSKRKGATGQSQARQYLEAVTGLRARFHGRKANEEDWTHLPVRCEAKAGRSNGANSVFGHYFKAENQAAAARAVGDPRPFLAAFRPDGVNDVLFVVRGSQLAAVVDALSGNA